MMTEGSSATRKRLQERSEHEPASDAKSVEKLVYSRTHKYDDDAEEALEKIRASLS